MNLTELDESLPNGLHDAELHRLTLDYVSATVVLELDLWVATDLSPRELYRRARITLRDVGTLAIEPPGAAAAGGFAGPVTIDLATRDLVSSHFRLFIREWNAFIAGSAEQAELDWCGAEVDRRG